MKFFVLDDQPERCEGLKTLLRQIDRYAKFTEAQDWQQVMYVLKFGLPDLLVIDCKLRWMDSTSLVRLLQAYPTLRVAILNDVITSAAIDALLHIGVLGVIPRQLDPRLILRAFELVLLGEHYVPVCALSAVLSNTEHACKTHSDPSDTTLPQCHDRRVARLSPRQHQIMRLVHMGNTNKMIARILGISEGTVKIHLASTFRLLGATNRASAVAFYNNWQFEKLQIWHSNNEAMGSKPVPGMRSPVPLRPRNKAALQGLPATSSLLAAAQTTSTYLASDKSSAIKELPADGA